MLVGAFKAAHGGWTVGNVRDLVRQPYIGAYETSIKISLATALVGALLGLGIAYAAIRDGTPRWFRGIREDRGEHAVSRGAYEADAQPADFSSRHPAGSGRRPL